MDTSEIHRSGIIKKGEELLELREGYMPKYGKGALSITNRRLLFLKKPGLFSKGFHVMFECYLGDIVSVTITGLISKQINIQVRFENDITSFYKFGVGSSDQTEIFAEKLIGAKDEFIEEVTVEAQRIIIQEGIKDNAAEILKKRLARGEITLEEFHKLVQRT